MRRRLDRASGVSRAASRTSMNGFFFSCGSDLVNAEKGLLHGGKRGRQLRFIVEGRRVRVVGEGSGAHPECDDLVLVVVAVAVVVSSPATTAIRRAARANSNRMCSEAPVELEAAVCDPANHGAQHGAYGTIPPLASPWASTASSVGVDRD